MNNYDLPVPLTYWDKYGKTILSVLFSILFVGSLIGYFYITYISEIQYTTTTVIDDSMYNVIAIYPETIRPGQTSNDLIIKLVPEGDLKFPVRIAVVEKNPSTIVFLGEKQKEIKSADDSQFQIKFDVVNSYKLPNIVEVAVTITQFETDSNQQQIEVPKDGLINMTVNKLSVKQFALVTTIISGIVAFWLFIGQEIFKKLFGKKA